MAQVDLGEVIQEQGTKLSALTRIQLQSLLVLGHGFVVAAYLGEHGGVLFMAQRRFRQDIDVKAELLKGGVTPSRGFTNWLNIIPEGGGIASTQQNVAGGYFQGTLIYGQFILEFRNLKRSQD